MYEYVYNGSAYNKQVNIKHVFVCIQSLAATLRSSGAGENEPQETVEPVCLLHFALTCWKFLPRCFGSFLCMHNGGFRRYWDNESWVGSGIFCYTEIMK